MRGLPKGSVVLAAAAMAGGSVAVAQVPQQYSSDEIVVTATALGDRSTDTVQGHVTLDRDDVIDRLGDGLGDTLDAQPGVASTSFGRGASRPIIRGLGEDRIRLLSNGLAQIDASAVSADHAVASEGLEAEAIEVLRGAAALAYGGNAVGGVVNVRDGRILEERPGRAVSGQVMVSAATGLDEIQAAGALTFAGDRFALRLDGFTRDAGDFAVPGFVESARVRAEEAEEALEEGEPPPAFARDVAVNSFAEADGVGLGISTYGAWGFAGASVRTLDSTYGIPKAAHEHAHEHDHEHDYGDEPAAFGGPRIVLEQTRTEARAGLNVGFGPINSVLLEGAYVDYQHAEIEETGEVSTVFANEGFEARAEALHAAGRFSGVLGLTGSSLTFSAAGEEAFVTPTDIEDIGLFAVQRWQGDRWRFDGGARVERRSYDNQAFGERTFDLFAGSIGASVRPIERLLAGVTLSRTERAPTEIELFADGAHLATASFEQGDPRLGKETAVSVEGTLRWRGERFEAEVNAFRIAFDNYTTFFATGLEDADSELPIFQAGQRAATFTGGEVTAWAHLFIFGQLAVRADASFDTVRAEFDGGGGVPRIPPRSVTLGVQGEAARLLGRMEWVSVADAEDLAAFETPTDGYDLLNARFTYRLMPGSDGLVVRLDARNLTDQEARVHPSFVKDLLPRPGRSVRLVLSSRF